MKHQYLLTCSLFVIAAVSALGSGNGLRGDYFNNSGLLGSPTLSRTDQKIDFTWSSGGPGSGVSDNYFSARWTGQVDPPATGAYKFAAYSDNGIRVWVNNALIIDKWAIHGNEHDTSAAVHLTAGQRVDLKVEFFEDAGAAQARLLWLVPGQTQEAVIPQAQLYSTAVPAGAGVPVYLNSLTPTFAQNGWGVYQKDRSNGEQGSGDGQVISLNGVKFSRGLGVHAHGELRYALAAKYRTFLTEIGIDDEVGNRGSVIFQVWLDGVKAFESAVLRGANAGLPVSLSVAGKNELKLIVLDGGDGNGYDHADWADARLTVGPAVIGGGNPPPSPTNLTAAAGDKEIKLAWTASAGAASYSVFRGTASNAEGSSPVMQGIAATTFTNTGLIDGTKYFYKVMAVNSAGSSGMSNEASATPEAPAPALPAPTGLTATAGDKQVSLKWNAVAGATSYNVYRGTSSGAESPIATGLTSPAFLNTGLTNGTTYFYEVTALSGTAVGSKSAEVSAKPAAPPPLPAPAGLTATSGDKQVSLTWSAVTGATSYNVYRGTSAGGENAGPVATGLTNATFLNTGLTNGTTYFYEVAALSGTAVGIKSAEVSAKPAAPPLPAVPGGLTALPGNQQVVLSWTIVPEATSYNVYRGTTANAESNTAIITGLTSPTFTNVSLTNGTTYFYKVASVNANGTSAKSAEAFAMPTAPGLLLTQAQKDAFRFLRQSTFGPTTALVNHVAQVGKPAFLDEQFALPPTPYPDALITKPNMELVSEQFFQNAMQGQDQVRQRVAWALSQIFVVSAVKVDNTHAMIPYIRMLEQGAFGNVKTLIHDVTLSPAMGEFLDMVNNKKADGTGVMPNENYAREWLQLFTIGLVELNDDGSPVLVNGVPKVTYDQSTVADMARVLSGWTYGDAKATNPTKQNPAFYDGPMKPVDKFHDTGQKTVLGQVFPAGQTAQQDLDQAINLVFSHHNLGPFLVRELIQRLVTSNPSPTYIRDVVGVFNNNGQGVRGDLQAVVRAILLHPEASTGIKFSEPALFLTTICRALCTGITDHPFMTDFSQSMAQQIWFAPSVFNYFSPNYRAGTIFAPELQIWSTANALTRTNWISSLLSGGFGGDVKLDLTPFTPVAPDPNALLDTVDSLIMGGTMTPQVRASILTAVKATNNSTERIRTALYLTAASMQFQVEH